MSVAQAVLLFVPCFDCTYRNPDTGEFGEYLPPAKFATIAEHVWLLEKTSAPTQFLVFGHDREVPLRWLERYGPLVGSVQFFFLSDKGHPEVLQ